MLGENEVFECVSLLIYLDCMNYHSSLEPILALEEEVYDLVERINKYPQNPAYLCFPVL